MRVLRHLPLPRLQETGLIAVIAVIALFIGWRAGSIELPLTERAADGHLRVVTRELPDGSCEAVRVRRNKLWNAQALVQLAKDTSFIAIMAVGATCVIVVGGVDLSVGALFALSGMLAALVLRAYGADGGHGPPALGIALASAVGLGSGLLGGLLNGGLGLLLGVHPFIVTLGTMAIYRCLAFVIAGAGSITGFPTAFRELVRVEVGPGLGLMPLVAMVVVTVIVGVWLARTVGGRHVYAVGHNADASRHSGIAVDHVRLTVFALAGLVAGLAALLNLGYYGSAASSDGSGYELKVIAAAVVGGASLSGGKGSALGAMLGALLMQLIDTGILLIGWEQNLSPGIMGLAIIVAVAIEQGSRRLAQRPG